MLVARGGAHRHPWRQHNRGAGGQRSVVLCCAVLCCAVLYVAVLRCALRCFAVLCGALRCFAVLCGAVRCGAVRCGAVWCGVGGAGMWLRRPSCAQQLVRAQCAARPSPAASAGWPCCRRSFATLLTWCCRLISTTHRWVPEAAWESAASAAAAFNDGIHAAFACRACTQRAQRARQA